MVASCIDKDCSLRLKLKVDFPLPFTLLLLSKCQAKITLNLLLLSNAKQITLNVSQSKGTKECSPIIEAAHNVAIFTCTVFVLM